MLDLRHLSDFEIELPLQRIRRSYHGGVWIKSGQQALMIVNQVGLEDYVSEVVLGEVGIAPTAAMQAQAVLARSYAVRSHRPAQAYDLSDLAYHQVYPGKSVYSQLSRQRTEPVQGQLLKWQRETVQALYHAECGSRMYGAREVWGKDKIAYLVSQPLTELLQGKPWHKQLSFKEISQIFGEDSGPFQVTMMDGVIGVKNGHRWLPVDEFRLQVNRKAGWNKIPSNEFTISYGKDGLNFHGRGRGHLVGMCQQQAGQLAEQGWNYQQILYFFYPGTRLFTGL